MIEYETDNTGFTRAWATFKIPVRLFDEDMMESLDNAWAKRLGVPADSIRMRRIGW